MERWERRIALIERLLNRAACLAHFVSSRATPTTLWAIGQSALEKSVGITVAVPLAAGVEKILRTPATVLAPLVQMIREDNAGPNRSANRVLSHAR